jgi:hypothetical protein
VELKSTTPFPCSPIDRIDSRALEGKRIENILRSLGLAESELLELEPLLGEG